MKRQLNRFALWFLPLALSLGLSGCGTDFYLTEYETAALNSQLLDQNAAQTFAQLLAVDPNNLAGTRLVIQFDLVNGRPQVRSTNLAQQLRRTFLLAQENLSEGQLNLDRVSGEFERQLNTFLADRLQIYANTGGAEVTLERLDEMVILLNPAPAVSYQPGRQLITLDASFQFTLRGTVRVEATGFLGWFASLFGSAVSRYPMVITVNNYRLHAEARLLPDFDAAQLAMSFRPVVAANDISVTGDGVTLSAQISGGARQLLTTKLNAPLDDTRVLRYQNFTLSEVTLRQAPAQLNIAYRPWPETARPVLHAVARGADGKLYHARRAADVWSAWQAAPFPNLAPRVDNDPALLATGAEQLELAAIASDNKLMYAHWRNGAWGGQATLGTPVFLTLPGQQAPPADFQGKPALVATAPGQVEIIASGRDGRLWHLRRLNGVWQTAAPVNLNFAAALPLRDPVAAQSGNKIAVFFADANNRLYYVDFNLETNAWGTAGQLVTAETLRYAPAAVASGDGRIDVAYIGASGSPFHRFFSVPALGAPGSFGAETRLDGSLNAAPELVASGFQQLDLVGRGTDNRLYHRHYVGPQNPTGLLDGRVVAQGWTNWDGLSRYDFGQRFVNFQAFNGQMSDFTLAATATGQLETLARNNLGNPQNALFQTAYDSAKYGRDLWKTVGWRGLQKIGGTANLTGKPALAACDQHLEMAFVSNNGGQNNVRYARLAESHTARFNLSTSATVATFPNPLDPLILANGPGLTDLLYLGADGIPRHVRRYNNFAATARSLALPAGTVPRSALAATSYGNGWLDLVIVGADNGLYHWRFRNGLWSAPTRLNGSVISAPVLASVGAGNLELLALGGDQKLYRWRFVNGAWANWQQLAGNFAIDAAKFGASAISSYGDGALDIAVVSAQNGAVYQRRVGGYENLPPGLLNPPARGFNFIGGNVADTPALLAAGPATLYLLARGTDSVTYFNAAFANGPAPLLGGDAPIAWRGYAPVSQPGLLIGSLVASGPRDVSALGVDTGGRLFLNRYDGMNWRGFLPVAGQTPAMQLGAPLFRPTLAGH